MASLVISGRFERGEPAHTSFIVTCIVGSHILVVVAAQLAPEEAGDFGVRGRGRFVINL